MNIRNLFLWQTSNYTIVRDVNVVDLRNKFENSWKNPVIVQKQYALTVKQFQAKTELPAVKALISDVRTVSKPGFKVLEVGCSTGYHHDYFKEAGLKINYQGCDYSAAFITKARELHPNVVFKVSDAKKLAYKKNEFDIVISGCCLLHILDYEKAIKESARVAEKYVIFHRTPVLHGINTTYATKVAYNTSMVEIFFNESELVKLFNQLGLNVVGIKTVGKLLISGLSEPVFMKNYLCKKI